jgi:hypothetical protein
MSARELAVTILGLAGTFFMPWPGEVDRGVQVGERASMQASACPGRCEGAEPASLRPVLSEPGASAAARPVRAARLPVAR